MGMKETLMADMKTAMRDKNSEKLAVIRFLQAAIKNKEIELRPNAITDQDELAVMKKLVSQLKEAITQYEQAGRTDLADKEKAQLKVVESYLPAQMSREQLEGIVAQVIKETGASSVKDMGNVIKATIAKTAGAADNKLISELVRSRLN